METYLAIIATALVATQIIRLVQNTIQLRRDKKTRQEYTDTVAKWEETLKSYEE